MLEESEVLGLERILDAVLGLPETSSSGPSRLKKTTVVSPTPTPTRSGRDNTRVPDDVNQSIEGSSDRHSVDHDRLNTPGDRSGSMNRNDLGDDNRVHYRLRTEELQTLHESDFQSDLIKFLDKERMKYAEWIEEELGQPLDLPSGTKPSSNIPKADKLSSKASADEFDDWLKAFIMWLALNHYVGPAREKERLFLIGSHIDDDVRTWYNTELWNKVPNGTYERFEQYSTDHLSFEDNGFTKQL
ncbi:hypothetical protein ONZ45_g18544 [Pleurotus djamor]|nr:hypothetical protein ONZ45_g18544 [Pleurotus djamor]